MKKMNILFIMNNEKDFNHCGTTPHNRARPGLRSDSDIIHPCAAKKKVVSYKIRITILYSCGSCHAVHFCSSSTWVQGRVLQINSGIHLFSSFLLENSIRWQYNLAWFLNVWYEVHVHWIMLVWPVGVHAPSCIQVSMWSIDKMQ